MKLNRDMRFFFWQNIKVAEGHSHHWLTHRELDLCAPHHVHIWESEITEKRLGNMQYTVGGTLGGD